MTVAAKAAAALLLLTVSMAAADTPATVADALAELKVTAFSRALNQFPDLVAMVGPDFAGTVFAPTNKGWNAAVKAVEAAGVTLTDAKLKDILLYHIIPGPPAPITGLNDDQIFVSALDAETVVAQYNAGKLTLESVGSEAEVVIADTNIGPAHYGVVHTINNMLLPFVLPGGTKLEPGGVKADSVQATSIDTSNIDGAVNAAGDSLNTALGNAQAALGSAAGSMQDAASAAANAVQQAAAGAATSGQAAVGAANGAVTGAVGGAATAVTDTAGTVIDGAMGAVPGAVAGVGAPDAADVNALAAGPAAGPAAAPSPSAAPEPVSAPESVPVPVSSAATASCKYVVLAIVALVVTFS